jgi:hypothetical protein
MADLATLIQRHAETIIAALADTLDAPDPRAKLEAAQLLLLWGWGRRAIAAIPWPARSVGLAMPSSGRSSGCCRIAGRERDRGIRRRALCIVPARIPPLTPCPVSRPRPWSAQNLHAATPTLCPVDRCHQATVRFPPSAGACRCRRRSSRRDPMMSTGASAGRPGGDQVRAPRPAIACIRPALLDPPGGRPFAAVQHRVSG